MFKTNSTRVWITIISVLSTLVVSCKTPLEDQNELGGVVGPDGGGVVPNGLLVNNSGQLIHFPYHDTVSAPYVSAVPCSQPNLPGINGASGSCDKRLMVSFSHLETSAQLQFLIPNVEATDYHFTPREALERFVQSLPFHADSVEDLTTSNYFLFCASNTEARELPPLICIRSLQQIASRCQTLNSREGGPNCLETSSDLYQWIDIYNQRDARTRDSGLWNNEIEFIWGNMSVVSGPIR